MRVVNPPGTEAGGAIRNAMSSAIGGNDARTVNSICR